MTKEWLKEDRIDYGTNILVYLELDRISPFLNLHAPQIESRA